MRYTERVEESIKKCAEQISREDMRANAAYKLMKAEYANVADIISYNVFRHAINIEVDALITEKVEKSIKKCAEQIVRDDMRIRAAYVDVSELISYNAYRRAVNIAVDELMS